jgi:hypothetical protein
MAHNTHTHTHTHTTDQEEDDDDSEAAILFPANSLLFKAAD